MKLVTYFLVSSMSMVAFVLYAITLKEQFYPTILFLVNSKISFVLGLNFAVVLTFMTGKFFAYIFLGKLRDVEIELLTDRLKYYVMEVCLSFTTFRNDLSMPVFAQFLVLLFLKSFHWLSKSRLEYLEQILPITASQHARQITLMTSLLVADVVLCYYCLDYTIKHGKSVLILFGFEAGLLVLHVLSIISRYVIQVLDNHLPHGLTSKGLYIMILDLLHDALAFITYVCFFALVSSYYGLPLHIIRETWIAFTLFHRRLTSLAKYVRLMHNLEQRFPDATPEEIESAGDCLVCREGYGVDDKGKKLPCSHVFHLDCLRSWLQHQQTCPLCRADIPVNSALPTDAATDAEETPRGDAEVAATPLEPPTEPAPAEQTAPPPASTQEGANTTATAADASANITFLSSAPNVATAAPHVTQAMEFPAFYRCLQDVPICKATTLEPESALQVVPRVIPPPHSLALLRIHLIMMS